MRAELTSLRGLGLALLLGVGTSACVGQPARDAGQVELQPLYSAIDCGRGSDGPAVWLVTGADQFASLWRRLTAARLPAPAMPAVDFSRARVAVVESGRHPDAGRRLELTSHAAVLDGSTLRLPARVTEAERDVAVAQVLTSPCLVLSFEAPAVTRVEALGVGSRPPDGTKLPAR